jgi:lipopolysaccharide/colanic/teichoic acid biosynthesis glycosyltransferase
MNFYDKFFKRLLGFVLSILGLLIISPLFVVVAIVIKVDSRGKIFFTQERVGVRGEIFKIVKFRTMRRFEDSFNRDGSQMENYSRVTKIGKLLRKTSIDELPQLFNILVGHMSLVGPRPALPYQVERYSEYQRRRLLVRPGITGLAQVSGRNSLSWEEKIELDIRYVNKVGLLKDILIIIKTFPVVFKADKQDFVQHDAISAHKADVLSDVGMVDNKYDRSN